MSSTRWAARARATRCLLRMAQQHCLGSVSIGEILQPQHATCEQHQHAAASLPPRVGDAHWNRQGVKS